MNTSDNSIYFMDSAFKRRWDWEFMDCEERTIPDANYFPEGGQLGVESITRVQWNQFVQKLNLFFKSKHQYIRGIEDKQIGRFFIKDGKIEADKLRGKLMFFVWDSVFQRDKKPLLDLLNSGLPEADKKKPSDLITFGDFCMLHNSFINAIFRFGPQA
jgi:5-methylcytosine-specific restriction endonuclease McrBC GTP-binding regulatory subunit McrB